MKPNLHSTGTSPSLTITHYLKTLPLIMFFLNMVDYPMFSLLLSTFHAYKLALTFLELEQVWAWTKDFGLGLGLVNFQKKKCFILKMDLYVMSCFVTCAAYYGVYYAKCWGPIRNIGKKRLRYWFKNETKLSDNFHKKSLMLIYFNLCWSKPQHPIRRIGIIYPHNLDDKILKNPS